LPKKAAVHAEQFEVPSLESVSTEYATLQDQMAKPMAEENDLRREGDAVYGKI
jgi:hypothetical protein